MSRKFGFALLWLNAVPLSVFIFCEGAAEVYCAHVLPCLRAGLARISAHTAMPVCGVLIVCMVIAIALCLLMHRSLSPLLPISALLILALSLTWAAPCALSEPVADISAAQLEELCLRLSFEASSLYAQERAFERSGIAIYAARLCRSSIVPKAASPAFMRTVGLSGYWSPLTSEAMVDMSMSEINLPFTLCHELMHAKGIASEARANYEAYLACMQGDAVFRYSGAMNALWFGMHALQQEDGYAWARVVNQMDDSVLTDFRRMNGLSELETTPLTYVQNFVTDLYQRLTGIGGYDGFAAYLLA